MNSMVTPGLRRSSRRRGIDSVVPHVTKKRKRSFCSEVTTTNMTTTRLRRSSRLSIDTNIIEKEQQKVQVQKVLRRSGSGSGGGGRGRRNGTSTGVKSVGRPKGRGRPRGRPRSKGTIGRKKAGGSPTSTAKPSPVLSPARKRTRRNSASAVTRASKTSKYVADAADMDLDVDVDPSTSDSVSERAEEEIGVLESTSNTAGEAQSAIAPTEITPTAPLVEEEEGDEDGDGDSNGKWQAAIVSAETAQAEKAQAETAQAETAQAETAQAETKSVETTSVEATTASPSAGAEKEAITTTSAQEAVETEPSESSQIEKTQSSSASSKVEVATATATAEVEGTGEASDTTTRNTQEVTSLEEVTVPRATTAEPEGDPKGEPEGEASVPLTSEKSQAVVELEGKVETEAPVSCASRDAQAITVEKGETSKSTEGEEESESIVRKTRSSIASTGVGTTKTTKSSSSSDASVPSPTRKTRTAVSPGNIRKSSRVPRKRSLEIQDHTPTRRHSHSPRRTPANASSKGDKRRARTRTRTGSNDYSKIQNIDIFGFDTSSQDRNQMQNYNWKESILQDLQRKVRRKADPYGFFSKPVDPIRDECPDYYKIVDIKETTCFNAMGELIENGKIKSIDQYVQYLDRIIKCGRKYNSDEDNFVRMQVDLIEERTEGFINSARMKWEEMEEKEKKEVSRLRALERQERRERQKAAVAVRKSSRRLSTRRRSYEESNVDEDSDYDDDIDDEPYSVKSSDTNRQSRTRSRRKNDPPLRQSSRLVNKKEEQPKSLRLRRPRKNEVIYNDDENSIGSLSESDRLPPKDDESDDGLDHDGPIIGSEIPFCKPTLLGSTMTPCNTREEWLQLCPKLATVCNEAARRSTLRINPNAKRYEKPLSEVYIRERLEYDSPLDGFVVQTKAEPQHIQGFIVATTFATFRNTFRFTMDEPAALITPTDHRTHLTDVDGLLTKELQEAERVAADFDQGYKYPRIGEISLLGGLGCGSPLLSRVLSDLQDAGKYDYIVLQSTKIAIPFYEKHGFVRIGAVTRFNDIETLPEVAYRHWSEIVNGEAVEPSYMMARRLKISRSQTLNDSATIQVRKQVTEEERCEEIRSALKAAYSLLSDTLTVRLGSMAYTNSFREILSAAREFAISADDYTLVKVIDKALSEFTGSHFGKSKRILRSELRHGRSTVSDDLKHAELQEIEKNGENEQEVEDNVTSAAEGDVRLRDYSVVLNPLNLCKDDESSSDNENTHSLSASLPADLISRDDYFRVKIKLNEESDESNDGAASEDEEDVDMEGGGEEESKGEDEGQDDDDDDDDDDERSGALVAKLDRQHKSSMDLLEATELAVENLMSFVSRKKGGSRPCQVAIGDEIMLKIEGYDGSPLWVDATVKKNVKMKGTPPYYSGKNGYLVEWEEIHATKRKSRVLDMRNRGVGKSWCTEMDWASFSVLPIDVLDSLLIGGKVSYPDVGGQLKQGRVTKRIGGGLDGMFKYRVENGKDKKKGSTRKGESYAYEDLTPGAIREAISIPDKNIVNTRKLLKDTEFEERLAAARWWLAPEEEEDEDEEEIVEKSKQKKKLKIQSAEAWADYRLEEYNLVQISEDEKKKRKRSCNKVDDLIVHLSTGIGAKSSAKSTSNDASNELGKTDEELVSEPEPSVTKEDVVDSIEQGEKKVEVENKGDNMLLGDKKADSLTSREKENEPQEKKRQKSLTSGLRRSTRNRVQAQ